MQPEDVTVTSVAVQQQSGASWSTVASLAADADFHPVTGLTIGTTYSFRIRLVTSGGNADSEPVSVATLTTPQVYGLKLPSIVRIWEGRPEGVIGTGWTEGIIGVELLERPSENVTVTAMSIDAGAATVSPASLTFTLSNWNTTQTVKVTAVLDEDLDDERLSVKFGGVGVITGYVPVTVRDTAPIALRPLTQCEWKAARPRPQDTFICVTEGETERYEVALAAQPSQTVTVSVTSEDTGAATVSPASLTFTRSNWNAAQTVTVTGEHDADTADEAVTLTFSGGLARTETVYVKDDDTRGVSADTLAAPIPATGLTVFEEPETTVELARTTVSFEWTLPAQPSGVTVTAVEVQQQSGTTWSTVATLAADVTSYKVTGLTAEMTYRFRIRLATNSGNADSEPMSWTTLAGPKPAAGLTASNATQTTVDLAWTLPAQATGVTVTGIEVQQQATDASWTTIATLAADATSHTVTGLTEGTSYSFRIRVTTNNGNADTDAVSATTLAAPKPATGLTASNATETSVDLAWTLPAQPAGVTVTGIEVQQQATDASWTTIATLAADAASHTVTGLTAGTAYRFRIRLVTGNGNADTDAVSATTLAAPITGFTLFDNANGGADVQALTEGAALAALSSQRLNIRAEVASDAEIGSVRMELSGQRISARTEGIAPYALFGDRGGQAFPAGTYTVTATPYPERGLGGTPGPARSVTFTVAAAAPALPEVSIAAETSPVTEGTAATFRLSRTGTATEALTVDVSVTGTEVMPMPTPATVRFGPGESGKTLSVGTDDRVVDVEAASTVTAAIVAGAGYRIAAGAGSAQVSVVDDDAAVFSLSASPASIAEGEASTVTVAITNGVTFKADQAIALSVAGGTAVKGADYTVAPEWLTLVAGRSSATATVTALDDTVEEPAETIVIAADHGVTRIGTATVTIAAPAGPLTAFTLVDATTNADLLTLRDGTVVALDSHATESFGVRAETAPNAGIGSVGFELTGALRHSKTESMAPYSLYGDTSDGIGRRLKGRALPVGDYRLRATTWSEAGLQGTVMQTLEVAFAVAASAAPPSTDAALRSLTLGGVALSPSFASAKERYTASVAHSVRSVTVTAAPNDGNANVAFTPAADAGAPGHQVALAVGDNVIAVTVTAGDGITRKTYTVTVTRAAAPAVTASFGQASYTAAEGGAAAAVTVRLNADPERAVEIPLTAAPRGGAVAEDYAVPVTAADDDVDDDGKSVALGFGTLPAGVTAGGTTATTVSLADDDERGVRVTPQALSMSEGGTKTYAVVLASEPTAAVTVEAAVTGDTDVTLSPASLRFAPGDWNTPRTVTVSAGTDADTDSDEATIGHTVSGGDYQGKTAPAVAVTVTETAVSTDATLSSLTLSGVTLSPSFASTTERYTASAAHGVTAVTVTAAANDGGAEVAFDPSTDADAETSGHQAALAEGDNVIAVTVTAADGTTKTYTVTVTRAAAETVANTAPEGRPVISGTARVGETLTASASGITDADGLGGAAFAWQWMANDGTADADIEGATGASHTLTPTEAGRTVKVRVTFTDDGGTEETLVSEATAAVKAAVEAPPPEVSIAAAASPVTEGSTAVFTLRRTGDAAASLTVAVTVAEDGAVLSGAAPSVVTFPANVSEARLGVSTHDDDAAEADGRVTATIASGAGYRVTAGAGSAGIDVLDNDRTEGTASPVTILWSADMKVLDFGGGAGGATSPDRFSNTAGSGDLQARWLWYDTGGRSLHLTLSAGLPDAGEVTLHVDGLALTFPDGSSGDSGFDWDGIDLDWTDGQTVAVRLTRRGGADGSSAGPGVSVADAEVREEEAALRFRVTLNAPRTTAVSVRYATLDGTATAGEDYASTSGTLTFAPGATTKTVSVPVLDDARDEGSETLTLTLSNPVGGVIADAEATGTITNSDPLPKAWTARFGRTVASHVVDALEARLDGASDAYVQLGGHRLGGVALAGAEAARTFRLAQAHDLWEESAAADTSGQDMTVRDLLLGSAFHLVSNDERAAGPRLSAWGRVATSGFDGGAKEVSIDGTVTTATLGVDGVWKRWLTGVALAYSEGEGAFTQPGAPGGSLDSSLTSIHPYVGYALSERVTVWGILGYGSGALRLVERREMRTDLEMSMGAVGIRGTLLAASGGGLALALRSDALWMRLDSAATADLVATEAEASRLRLVLEGSRRIHLAAGGSLIPSLEVGLRHDGGDAETGSGLEVGGRIRYASAWGLSIEASVRGLLAHETSDYQEWGASGALRFDPGKQGRGLTASIMPTWGSAASGVSRLWGQPDAAGLAVDNALASAAGRLDAELGYGLAVLNGQSLLTPYARVALTEGSDQAWHLGARLALAESLNLSLEASRRAREGEVAAHELALLATLGW